MCLEIEVTASCAPALTSDAALTPIFSFSLHISPFPPLPESQAVSVAVLVAFPAADAGACTQSSPHFRFPRTYSTFNSPLYTISAAAASQPASHKMGICMSQGSAMDANVSEEDKRLHREAEKQLKEVRTSFLLVHTRPCPRSLDPS